MAYRNPFFNAEEPIPPEYLEALLQAPQAAALPPEVAAGLPEQAAESPGIQRLFGLIGKAASPPISPEAEAVLSPDQKAAMQDTGPEQNLRLIRALAAIATVFAPALLPAVGILGKEIDKSKKEKQDIAAGAESVVKTRKDLELAGAQQKLWDAQAAHDRIKAESELYLMPAQSELMQEQAANLRRSNQATLTPSNIIDMQRLELDKQKALEAQFKTRWEQSLQTVATKDRLGNIESVPALLRNALAADAEEAVYGGVKTPAYMRARKTLLTIDRGLGAGRAPEHIRQAVRAAMDLSPEDKLYALQYLDYSTKKPIEKMASDLIGD